MARTGTRRGAPSHRRWVGALAVAAMVLLAGCQWQTAWVRSQNPLSTFTPSARRSVSNQTVRTVARVRRGGIVIRVRLQNTFGASQTADGNNPITVTAATVARRTGGASVDGGSLQSLHFNGNTNVVIAPGQYVVSDPVRLNISAGDDVATSLFIQGPTALAGHDYNTVTQFASPAGSGDHTGDAAGDAFTVSDAPTAIASAIDVFAGDADVGTVVVTGGSVVDGFASTKDGYNNFPDQLAQRVAQELPAAKQMPVVNAGIAGTTATAEAPCSLPVFGPSVQARLERDTLSLADVADVIVWAGTNDLGFGCNGDQIISAFSDIATRTRAAGAEVWISTITPRASYTATQNLYRAQVNAWVRNTNNCGGACDHALDFDAVLRDPANPNQLNPTLNSGDGIHPNPTGYGLVAQSIDLETLAG